jgi:hypothetical protein
MRSDTAPVTIYPPITIEKIETLSTKNAPAISGLNMAVVPESDTFSPGLRVTARAEVDKKALAKINAPASFFKLLYWFFISLPSSVIVL